MSPPALRTRCCPKRVRFAQILHIHACSQQIISGGNPILPVSCLLIDISRQQGSSTNGRPNEPINRLPTGEARHCATVVSHVHPNFAKISISTPRGKTYLRIPRRQLLRGQSRRLGVVSLPHIDATSSTISIFAIENKPVIMRTTGVLSEYAEIRLVLSVCLQRSARVAARWA